jgi:aryl-alcohol dehydrogenase-like predicted oxidoreductase
LAVSAANGWARFETHQPLYNLYDRAGFEKELAPLCQSENLGVITYFSLAAGFLSGKYRSPADFGKSARGPRLAKYLSVRGLRVVDALQVVADARQCSAAQVAIAWLLARPGVTAPIVSATSLEQLSALVAATRLRLSAGEMQQLNTASEPLASDGPEASTAH